LLLRSNFNNQKAGACMCLAIPMRLTRINGDKGEVEMDGVSRIISLALLEDVHHGDYLIIHAGFAIEKLDEREANERLKLFRELAEIEPNAL